jgi:hypothetical protein
MIVMTEAGLRFNWMFSNTFLPPGMALDFCLFSTLFHSYQQFNIFKVEFLISSICFGEAYTFMLIIYITQASMGLISVEQGTIEGLEWPLMR